jgi:hypothetical protein
MDNQETVNDKVIEKMMEKSSVFFSTLFNMSETKSIFPYDNLRLGFIIHKKKSLLFSKSISIFKHTDNLDLQNNSIELNICNEESKFYEKGVAKSLRELDILNDKNHHILLGEPGAGKTTTLKRLVSKTYQLLLSQNTNNFHYSFPIVVRLSEIQVTETLLIHLCHQLGIDFDTIKKEVSYIETKEIEEEYFDKNSNETFTKKKQIEIERVKIINEYKIANYPLKNVIGEFLNEINCIIFLDGLDEVNFKIRDNVFSEIKEISNIIEKSKIIITSRKLQEIPSFKQFAINKIEALNNNQKEEIANFWLNKTEIFFSKLNKLPYQDIADRPLFLTFLLKLFNSNNDELPKQAVDVYRQIILLVLREWDYDKEQEIKRYSKYKTFNTYKKEDFLSELAFELTYTQLVKKIFNHNQLKLAYLNIYIKYPELGLEDYAEILRDIESHNGLVIETFGNTFEFSHLSLQEYLCAKYILSIPISRKHFELLNIYPAPFAIANVLSSKPEDWFAMLFISNIGDIRNSYQLNENKVYEFLDRLITEKIIFTRPTEELGFAILYLFFKFDNNNLTQKLIEFSKINYIYESVHKCLHVYKIETVEKNYYFTLKKNPYTDMHIKCVEKGVISCNSIKHLIK